MILHEARPFEEVWKEARPIAGWLSTGEAAWLYHNALVTPQNSSIVEIGAYNGKSTTVLAGSGRQIVTVDPLVPGHDEENGVTIVPEDYMILAGNVAKHGNVVWLPDYLHRIPLSMFPKNISMVFIDANHVYPHPKEDFEYLKPILADGTSIAFHDYNNFGGVFRSCTELEEAKVLTPIGLQDSLRVYKYNNYGSNRVQPDIPVPQV